MRLLIAGLVAMTLAACSTTKSDLAASTTSFRATLEGVYTDYLRSIDTENVKLLISVLPAARIADMKRVFAANGMTFPGDYFSSFKRYSPKMPPIGKFRFVALSESENYANLVYVGDMNGYLRRTVSEERFLVIQFELEDDGWKYGIIIDPPLHLVPDLKTQLASGKLDFMKSKPFSAEKIELRP